MLANIAKAITGALLGATALALPSAAWAGPTLLLDASDGLILYAEDYDNQWHPASLTKIMTAYVTFEALREGKLKLDSKIGCSELAYLQPPSKVGLPVGAEMTVETALQALIVKSANDVAVMLAEGVAGTQEAFVARMNATAARLGMTRTKFVNPNGLPAPEQVTTARDLAKLAQAVIRDYPEHARLLVAGRRQGRQAQAQDPQRPAHQLRGRRRPEDRLHLRQRLQRGRHRDARGPQADRRGARRADRPGAHGARREPARARLPDLRVEGAVRSAEAWTPCRWRSMPRGR